MSSACVPLSVKVPCSITQMRVAAPDGAEPVRDDEGSAADEQFGERFLDECFALAVERARRFVEDEDGRVLEQRARDGDALALAAAELHSAFTDERAVALGKAAVMNSWQWARREASRISSSVAPGRP